MEARAVGNYASNEESGATTRKMGGALGFLTTNTSRGAGGADGGYASGNVSAATDGTQRAFALTQIDDVQETAFNNGASLSQMYMSAAHKRAFSNFTGISDLRTETSKSKQATIVGGADVYLSNHGPLTVIPVQYGLTRDVLIIDPDMWCVGTLRGWGFNKLSKTGDNMKGYTLAEKTLVCKNEKGGAVIADLS